ncbi:MULTISPECIES: GNAT family N-acetyltransferase [unclassified Mycoplasma]
MDIKIKKLSEMTGLEAMHIFALRQNVFMIEQQCLYQDIDEIDATASHTFYYIGNEIACYLRYFESDGKYKIGRVITNPRYRRQGLMQKFLSEVVQIVKNVAQQKGLQIWLSAQVYALGLYEKCGFVTVGFEYLEDDIPHIDMCLAEK